MMKLQRVALVVFTACVLVFPFYSAQASPVIYGVGGQVGTLGIGPDLNIGFNRFFSLDIGLNAFNRNYTGTKSSINYNFNARLRSVHLLANIYPFAGIFHLSAGIVSNGNEFNLAGNPTSGYYTIDNRQYSAAEVGTLDGKIAFPGVAYYIGLGWGLSYKPDSHWGFSFDLGGLYQGVPDLTLSAYGGTLSNNPIFKQNLAAQQAKTQNDIRSYRWWPVVSFGLYFKF
jgi:hypothetical protein